MNKMNIKYYTLTLLVLLGLSCTTFAAGKITVGRREAPDPKEPEQRLTGSCKWQRSGSYRVDSGAETESLDEKDGGKLITLYENTVDNCDNCHRLNAASYTVKRKFTDTLTLNIGLGFGAKLGLPEKLLRWLGMGDWVVKLLA